MQHDAMVNADSGVSIHHVFEGQLLFPRSQIGPIFKNVSDVGYWLYPNQATVGVQGNAILRYLQEDDRACCCLCLRDLEIIRDTGVEYFSRNFGEETSICAWKSAYVDSSGQKHVHELRIRGKSLDIGTRLVIGWFRGSDPIVYFHKLFSLD